MNRSHPLVVKWKNPSRKAPSLLSQRESGEPISTKKQGSEKAIARCNPREPLTSIKYSPKSISTKPLHPMSIKKAKGKKKLLELIGRGLDLPCAVAAICLWAGYKSRSTVYKWIEEDPEFADHVHTVEMAVLGFYQMLEFEAVKGGHLLSETIEHVHSEKENGKRKEIKERNFVSRRWAKIDTRALIFGMKRRLARLKRIEQAEDKAKALMELD